MIDPNKTFVTSDHHFMDWKNSPFWLRENTADDDEQHIMLWNSVVRKDDLVLYAGDFCEGEDCELDKDELEELCKRLSGRKVLIKGNHDKLGDERYRSAFEDVVNEMRIDELNIMLIHAKEEATMRLPGERLIYGHEHRLMSEPPPTTRNSICVCAKWHDWKPITLAEAIRQMDAAQSWAR